MRIVKPYAKEMYNSNPMAHIESIGRVCYKSEDKITADSMKKFCESMYKSKHHAMLEHFIFIVRVPKNMYDIMRSIPNNRFMQFTANGNRNIISMSARSIIDIEEMVEYMIANGEQGYDYSQLVAIISIRRHIISHYQCPEIFGGELPLYNGNIVCMTRDELVGTEEIMTHGWHSVLFTCDRGITHEFVRHRDASFAQESTRYCNYSNGKFGGEIAVIRPSYFEPGSELDELWDKTCRYIDAMYIQMIHAGATAQQARTILPNSTKADIVITARNNEWKHIVDLRYRGVTGAPHPQMVEVMQVLVENHEWAHAMAHNAPVG